MEKIGIFYGLLEYITDIWRILWPFGNLENIPNCHHFCLLCQEKSGNPGPETLFSEWAL
jgi:hypothetical protein